MKSLCTSINPIAAGAFYYVTANGSAAKPYILLRTALARSSKVAVVKVGFCGRECLALHVHVYADNVQALTLSGAIRLAENPRTKGSQRINMLV
ncbi:hypothetical protein [Streptomyces sp. NPDC058847]|uniref:hypothetical protein n=1 Tax=Streptomyces sp. NPDC058847 TaxID=3346649 RepID=UPI0036977177